MRRLLSASVLLTFFVLLLFAPIARDSSQTYYVDFVNGSNSNDGLAKTTGGGHGPWKSDPTMRNSGSCGGTLPTYTHVAGDQHIFKGGVTWPAACFSMNITFSGTSGTPDYYGVDQTWFTGASFARPIFDMGGSEPSSNIVIQGGLIEGSQWFTIENIEIKNQSIDLSAAASQSSYGSGCGMQFNTFNHGGAENLKSAVGVKISKVYIHDWVGNPGQAVGSYNLGEGCFGGIQGASTVIGTTVSAQNSKINGSSFPWGGGLHYCGTVQNNHITYGWFGDVWMSQAQSGHIESGNEFDHIVQNVGSTGNPNVHTHVAYDNQTQSLVSSGTISYNEYHDNNAGLLTNLTYNSNFFGNVVWNNTNGAILNPFTATAAQGDNSGNVGNWYNNTMDTTGGPTSCMIQRQVNGSSGGSILGTFNYRNNICIGVGQGGGQWTGGTINFDHNRTMTSSEQTTYGFTSANKYYPTNVNDANVNGAGVIATCSGNFTPCVDSQGTNWFGGAAGLTRSASLAWDLGAYCLSNCSGASGPNFVCSPTSLSWPNQPLGTNFNPSQTTTCTNTGGSTLTISSIALTSGTDFSFTTIPSGGKCGTTVAAGNSCTITVPFTPTVLGFRTDTLTITDNASPTTQTINLSGTSSYFVQVASNYTAGPHSSIAATFPATQIGKVNYCTAYLYDPADTITSITDTSGNPYTPVSPQTTQSGNGIMRSFLATSIGNSSAPTVTVNFGSSSTHHGGLNCAEYIVVTSLDSSATGGGTLTATGNSSSPDSGPMTIPGTNEVLATSTVSFTLSPGVSSGWTARPTNQNVYADEIKSAGTYDGTATLSGTDLWITQITALTNAAPQAATPTYSPAAGTFTSGPTITISDTTPSSTITYCTDTTNTCTPSTTYSGSITPFSSQGTYYLRAFATAAGFTQSPTASGQYIIAPVIATPVPSPGAGSYTGPQSVTFTSPGFSPIFCSTQDGSTPTTDSNGNCTHGVAGATITVSSSLTVKVIATEAGFTDSAMASAVYTITLPQVVTPILNPLPPATNTAFHFVVTVTLSSTTSGATLCYRVDGGTPTASVAGTCDAPAVALTNGGTVILRNTYTVLSVIGTESGFVNSSMAAGLFVISGANSVPVPSVNVL